MVEHSPQNLTSEERASKHQGQISREGHISRRQNFINLQIKISFIFCDCPSSWDFIKLQMKISFIVCDCPGCQDFSLSCV